LRIHWAPRIADFTIMTSPSLWTISAGAQALKSSAIRDLLKITEQPGMINFAGGLPMAEGFPLETIAQACDHVLTTQGQAALQYSATQGIAPLRDWVAQHLRNQGMQVVAEDVLITTGSQQALDLVGRCLIEPGVPLVVEDPSYLGALQAFTAQLPAWRTVGGTATALDNDALTRVGRGARAFYVLPNFQNPSGRCLSQSSREATVATAQALQLPLIEDNPYGELWFDQAPPPPMASLWPQGVVYTGSFSKVLAPGFRLGYVVAPPALMAKLVQAKQAADLHSPTFNQQVVLKVLSDGLLDAHLPMLRARYQTQALALHAALTQHLQPLGVRWNQAAGGMFLWLQLPHALNAQQLLPRALAEGVAFVPGQAFYTSPTPADMACMRLSFSTTASAEMGEGALRLARALKAALTDANP
jgi:2-aminoadipate transaminase